MSTRFAFFFVFTLMTGCYSSWAVNNRFAYKTCIKDGQRSDNFLNYGELAEHCERTMLARQRNMAWVSQKLVGQYFRSLNKWKNGFEELEPALLERVSTCWRRSTSLKNKWISLYEKRKSGEIIMLKPKMQDWNYEEGIASIGPLPNSLRSLVGEVFAGELVLYRHTPSSINENFGRYRTAVYLTKGNETKRIHSDSQASCASKQGDLMVLDVNIDDFAKNMMFTRQNLDFRVRVMTRRQYFKTKTSPVQNSPVVKQIVGLALHYVPVEETISSHLIDSVRKNDLKMEASHAFKVGMRKKRNAKNYRTSGKGSTRNVAGNAECKRHSYQLSHSLYKSLNIQYPERHHEMLDLGECVGTCPHPISSTTLNATNHAIAISSDTRNRPDLTICCVPVTYKSIYYDWIHPDENYTIQKRMKDFVVTSCACR